MDLSGRRALLLGTALGGALAAASAVGVSPARSARMTGSSIAGPDAAGWVTDFLNAAYYRRPFEDRDPVDLRLAFAILTTLWHRHGHRRLRIYDVIDFHRAFGRDRFLDRSRSPRGHLDHEQLLDGAARLLGPWFPAAWEDDARRGWGIVFETESEKAAYRPEDRLAKAQLGPLTPPVAPGRDQTWHTYEPVSVPSGAGAATALQAPERWPDFGSELGRFTALRSGGLDGQTFEIEVAAGTDVGTPLFTRSYVTVTRLETAEDPEPLAEAIATLNDGMIRFGRDEPVAVPAGAEPLIYVQLTTHDGHFMGRAHSRLVAYAHHGEAFVRAIGIWDLMPWHLRSAYELQGESAQKAFWGSGPREAQSTLHQLARSAARDAAGAADAPEAADAPAVAR